MKAALLAATAAAFLAVAVATAAPAHASPAPWSSYLAPPAACPGSEATRAPAALQARAMRCLVDWTRRLAGKRRLRWSAMLAAAAGSKADVIASCGDFSHYPCGTRWPALATRRGRFHVFGENLYWGSRGASSPRAAMLAWLQSPSHRGVLFASGWSDLGVTVHRVAAFGAAPAVSIWVLEVAGRG